MENKKLNDHQNITLNVSNKERSSLIVHQALPNHNIDLESICASDSGQSDYEWEAQMNNKPLSSESDSDEYEFPAVEIQTFLQQWKVKNNITQNALSSLLSGLKNDIPNLPKDARTLMKIPKTIYPECMGDGMFVYLGICNGLTKQLEAYDVSHLTCLVLDFNVDGLPLFKSSNINVWPILCSINNIPVNNPFIVAMFCGSGKPPVHEYLKLFAFNSKEGCEKCVQKGQWAGKMVFPGTNATLRTDESFRLKPQCLEEESEVASTDGTSSEWSIKSNPGRCLESNSVPPPFPGESDDKRDSTVNITGVALFSGNKSGSGRSIKSNPARSLKSNSIPPPFPDESDDERGSAFNNTGVNSFSGNVDSRNGSGRSIKSNPGRCLESNPGRCLESNSVPSTFPDISDDERDSTVNITGVELFSGNVDSRRGSEEKLAALELRLTKLEDRKKISEIESFLNNEEIVAPPGLPMQSKEDLQWLNLKLQMKSEMAVYVEYLRSVGGRVERAKYVRRVLGAMFSKNFSVLCNLNGSSSKMMATGMGKIKLRSYHFVIKCLVSTVRIQYPNSKDKDFYPIFSRWFQGAIDQGDGRINRRAKSILIKNQLLLMNIENI
nr:uncharacterized protein LOC105850703 [Hydra vulgaris]